MAPDAAHHAHDDAAGGRRAVMVVIRVLLFLLIAAVTLLASLRVSADPTGIQEFAWALDWWFALFAAIGLTFAIIAIDLLTPKRKLSTITGVFFGLIVGLVAAIAVGFLIDLIAETYQLEGPRAQQILSAVKIFFGVALSYLGVSIVLQTQDDFRLVIPYVEFAKQIRGTRPLLLDSSALIDGRILDLAQTGLVQAPIVVPRFVVGELQLLADSSDRLKRARGRRGLDVVTELQRAPKLDVSIDEASVPGKSVDQMLVELARTMPAIVATTDSGLNRVAGIQGVPVLNMNDVANALKPSVVPGETLRVTLIKRGEQPQQGVGYLDDGTMVVAEDGAGAVGQDVSLTVTSMLQTSAGRLIFGRIDGAVDAAPGAAETAAMREAAPTAEVPAETGRGDDADADAENGPIGPKGQRRSGRQRTAARNPRRG